jgi:hypothetical protein
MNNPVRIAAIAIAALTAAALAGSVLWYGTESKRIRGLRSAEAKLLTLRDEIAPIDQRLNLLEAKLRNSRGDVIEAVDSALESVGLKDKMKSLKLVTASDMAEAEERAELLMEKVTLNETVNLFYTLETSPSPIITRRVTLKQSFEKPTLLNLSVTLSHLRQQ